MNIEKSEEKNIRSMQIDIPIAHGDRALLMMKEIITDCVIVLA